MPSRNLRTIQRRTAPASRSGPSGSTTPTRTLTSRGRTTTRVACKRPTLLRVALLCATGLEKDEACCAAKASGHVARTSMLSSSALEWHAAFALPIDTSSQFLRVALESTPGDEFGYSTIPLTNLKDGKVKRGWLAVRKIAAPGALSLGDVFLQAKAGRAGPRVVGTGRCGADAARTSARLRLEHDRRGHAWSR